MSMDLETKYGLPREVRFCKKCVISNQRPNSAIEYRHTISSKKATIHFDESGVCDACSVAEEKKSIDWVSRDKELRALCDRFRSKDGSYDCIVPGSGGKDSFYAAHKLKYEYGMHPLTVTWAPHIYTDWGWKNFQSWIHAGFDNYLCTPNGRVHRLLTRLALQNLFHPFQPFIVGQKAIAPKMALLHGIRLVFYGENEAEYGNPKTDNQLATRDTAFYSAPERKDFCLAGVTVDELENKFGLCQSNLEPYIPPQAEILRAQEIEVHYLGYYLRWHPQSCYYYAVENGGFIPSPERNLGTYSKYNSIDDKMDDFHFYTTYIKFGIGRATYDAAQEIRSGDITRKEGVALVRRFDGEFPDRFAEELFQYLSLPEKEFPIAHKYFESPILNKDSFLRLAESFRSPHLWKYTDGQWSLRHAVYETH